MSNKHKKVGEIICQADKCYALDFLVNIVASIRKETKKAIRLELGERMNLSDYALRNYIDSPRGGNYDLAYTKVVAAAEYFDEQIPKLNIVPADLYLPDTTEDNTPEPIADADRLGLRK